MIKYAEVIDLDSTSEAYRRRVGNIANESEDQTVRWRRCSESWLNVQSSHHGEQHFIHVQHVVAERFLESSSLFSNNSDLNRNRFEIGSCYRNNTKHVVGAVMTETLRKVQDREGALVA